MTIPRSDPVGQERKGIRYSDFPDLAKFLLPFRRDIDNPLAAFNNLDDSPMFQKQVPPFLLFLFLFIYSFKRVNSSTWTLHVIGLLYICRFMMVRFLVLHNRYGNTWFHSITFGFS
ncbi:hypothetical protein HanOQP8_Chr06g0218271 [Helianthus annuus]|nr:hypothetical protein HanOQP8_Chr06g0218271 [Helianthus annuus]